MPSMPSRKAFAALLCLPVAAALVAGCGSDSGGSGSSGSESAESRPAPPRSAFPDATGKTLGDLLLRTEAVSGGTDLVVLPAAQAFYTGPNRFPFGVFERDQTQVSDAEVALYFAKMPELEPKGGIPPGERRTTVQPRAASREALDQPAVGPFPASIESLQTQPAFRARTTTDDPSAASVVYATEVDFPSEGEWRIAALVKDGDEITGTLLPSVVVGKFERVPRVGDRAPMIDTPTVESAAGDLSSITTRIPPDTQNEVNYADVIGKEPIVLLFATPQFCESRVCGPVVDVAEQVKEVHGDQAAFIHMEIFNDNDPNKGPRPQVRAFNLPSEPWVFAIDRNGVVRETIEGAFGVEALTRAVKKAIGE
jgi:hypothetical protein